MAESPFIFEANTQNFAQVVMQYSQQAPVLVDFWADWCQPCKTLMPILAKLADEYRGGFILVKVNTDENQALAQKFGVRSLPTVKVFRDGQVIDEFMGALPEPQIRQFINKHRVRPTEPYRQQALALAESGDTEGAIQLMQQVLQHEPDFYEAQAELISFLLQMGRMDEADTLVQQIPADALPNEVMQAIQADLKLSKLRLEAGDADSSELEQRLANNPEDWDTMLTLAKLKMAQGDYEAGLALYFSVMQQNRSFGDDAGKQGLIHSFELLGPGHPLTKKYRSKMFSLLY